MKKQKVAKKRFVNPIYKDVATVLETGENNNGTYSLGELQVAPGGGNFFHMHSTFLETFIAIKGILGVQIRNEKHYLNPGESRTVPLHTPHYFFNDTKEPVICHVKLQPAHSGFIKGIAIAYGLAADGLTNKTGFPRKISHLALVIDLTDTRPTGFVGLLMPLLKWVAKRARKKGVEEELLDKYYYE